jgi:hypothetical protein
MQTILIAVLSFLIGVLLLLYGYRIFHMMLPVWGFLAGFWLGADLAALVLGEGFLGTIAGWVVGFAIGSVFAALAHFYHEVQIGVVGAVIGYAIGSGLLEALGLGPGIFSFLAGLVVAVIVAALFYVLEIKRIVITAATAAAGANGVLLAVLLLIRRIPLETVQASGSPVQAVLRDSWFWLLVWLAVGVLGYFYQLRARHPVPLPAEGYSDRFG